MIINFKVKIMKYSVLTIQAKRINKNLNHSKSFKGNDVIERLNIDLSSVCNKSFYNSFHATDLF